MDTPLRRRLAAAIVIPAFLLAAFSAVAIPGPDKAADPTLEQRPALWMYGDPIGPERPPAPAARRIDAERQRIHEASVIERERRYAVSVMERERRRP